MGRLIGVQDFTLMNFFQTANTPKDQYFALPTRSTTRAGNHHGLHYIKMFPVTKKYLIRYRTEGNAFATMIQSVIDKNERRI